MLLAKDTLLAEVFLVDFCFGEELVLVVTLFLATANCGALFNSCNAVS